MDRKHAPALARLNFDSLTDTITNLTGALILVVVLVIGITGQVRREGTGATTRGHTVDSLQEELGLLQKQTQEVEGRILELQKRWSALQSHAGLPPQPPAPTAKPAAPTSNPPQQRAKPAPTGGKLPGTSVKAGPRGELPVLVALHMVAAAPGTPPETSTSAAGVAADARRRALAGQVDAAIAALGQSIEGQTGRLTTLRKAIETLRSELASKPAASSAPPAKTKEPKSPEAPSQGGDAKGEKKGDQKKPASTAKKPPSRVTYRPPIEQFTRKTPIRFVCQNQRVSVLPLDVTVAERLQAFVSAERLGEDQSKSFEFDLPKNDFLLRGEAGKIVARFEAVRKPDRPGETVDEIARPGSLFRTALEATPPCGPGTHCVLFYVWPDSFEVYRKARSLVWEIRVGAAHYDDGWELMLPADPMRFVRGPGGRAIPVQVH